MHIALGRVFAKNATKVSTPMDGVDQLTERERDILEWITHGKTNWEIGHVLGLSELTVKTHVQRILKKLRVSNRTQAEAKVFAQNIIGRK